jgi:hypothetical protein
MKKSWMLFFFMPIFTSASYPIYDDNGSSEQPEPLVRESHSTKDVVKEKRSEKPSTGHSEEKALTESKQEQKDHPHFWDQKGIKSKGKPTSSPAEKNQSAISKRDLVKRNSAIQNTPFRSKLRQNPNRPRVIQRQEQKEPQNLSKIEADAEEVENELSTHQKEERGNQETSS